MTTVITSYFLQLTPIPTSQPSEDVQFEDGLVKDAFLTAYGLAINPVHKLYICMAHGTSLTKSGCRHHLREKDGVTVTQEMMMSFEELNEMYDIADEYPVVDVSQGPAPFIAGLPIEAKSGCPLCMYTASLKRVQQHMREEHAGSTELPLQNVPCQVLNAGRAPTNIRIALPTLSQSAEVTPYSIANDFKDFQADNLTHTVPTDSRMISPWLLRTGFHEYVKGKDVTKLMQLCTLPKDSETDKGMQSLHSVTLEYMEEGTQLIKRTDPLVLQMLNTPDPIKE